jgi:chromate transporter
MPTSPAAAVSLAQAARFWLRLGWVSFGGPAGQIALLHEELVSRRRWLSERRFLHALNYCMLLPGPEATQLATYLGWLLHGTPGGLIAGGLFLLPSILLLLALASLYALWGSLPLFSALFSVLRPTMLAIVLQAAWCLAGRTLGTPFLLLIAALSFVGLTCRLLPYPLLISLAALAGWGAARWHPALLGRPGAGRAEVPTAAAAEPGRAGVRGRAEASQPHAAAADPAPSQPAARPSTASCRSALASTPPGAADDHRAVAAAAPSAPPPAAASPGIEAAGQGPGSATAPTACAGPIALHDDDTPPPDHARFSRRRLASTLLLGGLAVLGPLTALTLWQGAAGLLPTLGRFFSRVALVSFGGAYAVLPYVAHGAVEQYGWLSTRQMLDGLALGETTPGPLIMVVAFVGVLGGWNQSGSLALALAAGLVVVWFTFLPSFLFILAGAPLVEASRGDLRLDGPLRAITAAVVGTIASLAALFSAPVLWPSGQGAWPDAHALALLLLMLALLVRWRWSVLRVIGLACLLGLLRALAAGLTG